MCNCGGLCGIERLSPARFDYQIATLFHKYTHPVGNWVASADPGGDGESEVRALHSGASAQGSAVTSNSVTVTRLSISQSKQMTGCMVESVSQVHHYCSSRWVEDAEHVVRLELVYPVPVSLDSGYADVDPTAPHRNMECAAPFPFADCEIVIGRGRPRYQSQVEGETQGRYISRCFEDSLTNLSLAGPRDVELWSQVVQCSSGH